MEKADTELVLAALESRWKAPAGTGIMVSVDAPPPRVKSALEASLTPLSGETPVMRTRDRVLATLPTAQGWEPSLGVESTIVVQVEPPSRECSILT